MKFDLNELVKQDYIFLNNEGLVDDYLDVLSLFDIDLDVLIKAIEQSTVLKKMWLDGNKLTLADGKLAKAIAKNTTLKELLLHNNNISDEGIKHLADALKENNNNTLQILDLGGNSIGDEGAKYIADMLVVNKTLQRITLDNNKIGDKGAESIATSLTINTGIREMWLDGNDITDAGAGKLADALESNHSIKTLTLYSTGISYINISKGMMDRIKAILQDPKRKKKQKDDELTKIVKALEEEYNRLMEELADAQKKVVSARQVKDQLNSALKEKEDALKLIASMKADIKRKKEEIEKKEQEVKSRDTDIANKDQQLKSAKVEINTVKSLEEENKRLQNELVDAQKKVAESDIDIANKNKQLESIKRILNPTDDEGEPASKRTRTEDTPNKAKVKSVLINSEHTDCSICCAKFSADLDSKDEDIRKHLPVLSSSKTCDHYFCHGCILKQQLELAQKNNGRFPNWIPCMICKTKTAFRPSEPKYHRLLIDILKKAEWVDAPKVKDELAG